MLVRELLSVLERRAPTRLAQEGDNCGLLVGDETAPVGRVIVALEVTEAVAREALGGTCDTILTHHPLLFMPVRSLVDSKPKERLLRMLVKADLNLIACHTNLDAASGGLADIAAGALGLTGLAPLEPAPAGWYKFVGFVPTDASTLVAQAVFDAGAGVIGEYRECAFAADGQGWFTPEEGAHPALGRPGAPERAPEVRWETVLPRPRLADAVRAFVEAHPYEEPAFDVYPVEDVLPRVGLGRVGHLEARVSVRELAARLSSLLGTDNISWSGDGSRVVDVVGVLPGSGRSLIDVAARRCQALITGDVGYHDAQRADEAGLSIISVPHGEFEWWALRHWAGDLATILQKEGVSVAVSQDYSPAWGYVGGGTSNADEHAGSMKAGSPTHAASPAVRLWIDGGSRGNPGPSAIGVVVEDVDGEVIDNIARFIGTTTNNVAEYRALLAGLEAAAFLGASEVEVVSDSELLVKQMRGEYKVKNEGLKPLHAQAMAEAAAITSFVIRHVEREQNTRADALVNRALDEEEGAGL